MKQMKRFLLRNGLILSLLTCGLITVNAGGMNPVPDPGIERDMSWWLFDKTMPYGTTADPDAVTAIHLDAGSFDTRTSQGLSMPTALMAEDLKSSETGMFLVQFSGPITREQKTIIQASGIKLYDYLPRFTFTALMSGEQAEQIREHSFINWVGRFHPGYRIHSNFGTRDLRNPERLNSETVQSVVTVLEPEYLKSVAERIILSGGKIFETISRDGFSIIFAEIAPGTVFDLARCEYIRRIEEQGEFLTLNDETQEVLQSGSVAGGSPVWDAGLHGEGQILGHMDSGIDPDHCFFNDDTQPLPTSTVNMDHRKIIAYRTYADGEAYDKCDNGHGTHTAGTAAGYTDDPAGLPYIGLAYEAKITAADVGKDDWLGCFLGMLSVPDDISVIYQDAYDDGARVHTNSWGSTDNTYDAMATQTDTFMWDHKDFLILYAIGNSGPDLGTMGTPATSKNIIAVGGSNNEPDQNQVWDSSSRGPVNSSNRMAPALMAPSTDGSGFTAGIDSSASDGTTGSVNCGFIGSGYQGTSMACPAAAGCAILTRQYFTDGYYPTGTAVPGNGFTPSAALIKATMINGAFDMTEADHRPNNHQGWGRILLDDSLYFSGDALKFQVEDDTTGIGTGDIQEYTVSVSSGDQPLRITLVWTDYPGNNLVNDLDLELIHGTETWHGNNFTSGWSDTGTTVDRNLPTECIFLNSTAVTPGEYTIRVTGYNVPQGEPGTGNQPYALVITGDIADEQECVNDGDVTMDGDITAGDAQLAFYITLGTYTPNHEEECAADCTGDGNVTAGDAQTIFQAALGTATCVDSIE